MSHSECNLQPPSPVYTLRGTGSPVTALSFTESSHSALISGCQSGKVHIWDLATRRRKELFDAHSGKSVLFVKPDNGAQKLLSQGRDGFLKIWKCSGPSYEHDGQIPAEGDGFCSATLLSPPNSSSSLIALPHRDSINVYSLADQSLVQTLSLPDGPTKFGLCMCMCAVPSPNEQAQQLLAGYENGQIILWDIRSGKSLSETRLHEDAVLCIAHSSGSEIASKGVSGSVDNTLAAWVVSDAGSIEVVSKTECTNAGFNDVVFRPDNKIFATAGWDHKVRIFSTKSLKPLCVLAYHRDCVNCVDFSDNLCLAAGSKDHLISVWDVYTNK